MQHNYYDDRTSNPPNTQPSSHQVVTWLDGLASQQYGMDPRLYPDPNAGGQYPASPHPGATASTSAYPSTGYPAASYPTATPGSYAAAPSPYPVESHPPHSHHSPYPPATYDPYSVQHASLNAHPGSAPVFLYPPSNAGPPAAYTGSPSAYASTLPVYPDDSDPTSSESSSRRREWSQHVTMAGAPRERIAVACDRCRSRKMKCDGAQPACSNCQRAAHQGVVCQYQSEPGRRGPDQGQRVRGPPGQRKPRSSAARRDQDASFGESSAYPWGTY